jgi:hypothetical protein
LVLLGQTGRVCQRNDDFAQQQQRSVAIERIANLADIVPRQFRGVFEQGDQMRLPRQVHAVIEGKGRQYLPNEGRRLLFTPADSGCAGQVEGKKVEMQVLGFQRSDLVIGPRIGDEQVSFAQSVQFGTVFELTRAGNDYARLIL